MLVRRNISAFLLKKNIHLKRNMYLKRNTFAFLLRRNTCIGKYFCISSEKKYVSDGRDLIRKDTYFSSSGKKCLSEEKYVSEEKYFCTFSEKRYLFENKYISE